MLNADSKTVKRRIVKVLVLYLIAAAVYHTAAVITALYSGGVAALRDYFCATFLDIGKILKLLFLNEDLAASHLWFLPALIYVYHVLLSNIFTYVLAAAGLDVTGRIFVNVWPLILFPLCIGFSLIKGIVLSSLKRRPPSHITPTSDS